MILEIGEGKEMNKKGVTLIELIVVFVIIAIMAGLLAPNIGAWLPNYRLRSATRDIVSTMRDAQMRAVSKNMHIRLVSMLLILVLQTIQVISAKGL